MLAHYTHTAAPFGMLLERAYRKSSENGSITEPPEALLGERGGAELVPLVGCWSITTGQPHEGLPLPIGVPLQAQEVATMFWPLMALPLALGQLAACGALCTWLWWALQPATAPTPTPPPAPPPPVFTLVLLLLELLEPLLLLLLLLPRLRMLFLMAAITEGFFDLESDVERGLVTRDGISHHVTRTWRTVFGRGVGKRNERQQNKCKYTKTTKFTERKCKTGQKEKKKEIISIYRSKICKFIWGCIWDWDSTAR